MTKLAQGTILSLSYPSASNDMASQPTSTMPSLVCPLPIHSSIASFTEPSEESSMTASGLKDVELAGHEAFGLFDPEFLTTQDHSSSALMPATMHPPLPYPQAPFLPIDTSSTTYFMDVQTHHPPQSPSQPQTPLEAFYQTPSPGSIVTHPPNMSPDLPFNVADTTSYERSERHDSQSGPLICKWQGCRHTGPFQRPAELMRHVRAVHVTPRSYICPVTECRKAFNRKDNLKEHIFRQHGNADEIWLRMRA